MIPAKKPKRTKQIQWLSYAVLFTGLLVSSVLLLRPSARNKSHEVVGGNSSQAVSLISKAQHRQVATRPIESIRVGDRVLAFNPEVSHAERESWEEPDWSTWYHLSLKMPIGDKEKDGAAPKILDIEIIRPESWVRSRVSLAVANRTEPKDTATAPETEPSTEAKETKTPLFPVPDPLSDQLTALAGNQDSAVLDSLPFSPLLPLLHDFESSAALINAAGAESLGLLVQMDLPEMGASGTAVVTDIQTCPHVKPGKGQVATATFAHPPSHRVLDIQFEDEPETIGVTENHQFWSVDRQRFLPIGQMEIGEHVETFKGHTKRIESQLPRPGPQVVYNLEVWGEHVYFVGEQGLLAHNVYDNNNGRTIIGFGLENALPELRRRGAITFEFFFQNQLTDIDLRGISVEESVLFFDEIRNAVSRSDGVLFSLDENLRLRDVTTQINDVPRLNINTTAIELRTSLELAREVTFLSRGRLFQGRSGLIEAAINNPTFLNRNGVFTGESADDLLRFIDTIENL